MANNLNWMAERETREKAKHTPGPWRVDYGTGIGKGTIYAEDPRFEGKSVAAAHFPPIYNGGSLAQEAFDISDANARLIAAAPELAGALWAVFDYADSDDSQRGINFRKTINAALRQAGLA